MSARSIRLGDIAVQRGGSVDPSKFPGEAFELFSIPAYDAGAPEVLLGEKIGSSKKCVQPGDVVVSRIVPHIRRAWVIGQNNGYRQIASGEWIVFRAKDVWPDYLRWVLVGDDFHSRFMRTVSGIGGSLLRARPSEVAKIEVVLPSLGEQKRIARILDAADALRAKRRESIAQLDALVQSTFLEMFESPLSTPSDHDSVSLGSIATVKGGKRLPKGEAYSAEPTPYRYIRVSDLKPNSISEKSLKYLTPDVQAKIARYTVSQGDVIISIAGTIGVTAAVPSSLEGVNLTENAAKISIRDDSLLEPVYLSFALQMPHAQSQILNHTGQVTIGKLALFRIEKIEVLRPPISRQRHFSKFVRAVYTQKARLVGHLSELDTLFASLQSRAFAGEL